MKFKVGQRYKVNCKSVSEYGNVIEIERIGESSIFYKTIKGENKGQNYFTENSNFAYQLEPVKNECVVIYRKDKETIALDKTTGKTGVAKCCPQDEYDFYTGAKLAFERLTGEQPLKNESKHVNCRCSYVKEVKRTAKVGEYIKIIECHFSHTNYENNDIVLVRKYNPETKLKAESVVGENVKTKQKTGKILTNEYVVLEGYTPEQPKEEFKPYLTYRGTNYGYIGEKTPIKDVIGRELKVGDTVEIYDKRKNNRGEVVIAFDDGKYFVMGIAGSCNNDGTIERDWKIIKKRSYDEIANGECVDGIRYVKEVKHD